MWLDINGKRERVAILIPTRGRAAYTRKMWVNRMKFLNNVDTWIGIERQERADYRKSLDHLPDATVVQYDNPLGSVAYAREYLRNEVLDSGFHYKWFVVTDDNALFTQDS